MFTAIIGQGTTTSVGSSLTFDSISWGASHHFLKVEVDYGNGLVDMGTTAFMSVPYSMNAKTAETATTASNVDPTDELQSLSISGDTLFISSGNYIILPSSVPNVLGCTDSTATNYNASANTDDGSCIAAVYGCMDSTAFNYNASANTHDGSCIVTVFGCTDPSATNYNPLANYNDGTCITLGCSPLSSTGMLPDTQIGLSNSVVGQSYNQYISIFPEVNVTLDVSGMPLNATTDYIIIDSIVGLPSNFTWNCDSSCTMPAGISNCFNIYSILNPTVLDIGVYPITIHTTSFYSNVPILGTFQENNIISGYSIEIVGITLGCMDSTAFNYNPNATTDDGSCIVIGSNYQGGIIFYILQPGDIGYVAGQVHGLIAAATDQSSGFTEWGCYGSVVFGADGTTIGSGAQNTIDILAAGCSPSGGGNSVAANICDTLNLGGYSDWFLPSKDELNQMFLNIGQGNTLGLGNVGGFANDGYWSSNKGNDWFWYDAIIQYFGSGIQVETPKNNIWNVRAVRAF